MRRRVKGRPLLLVTATLAVAAYACGSDTGNATDAGVDLGISEASGNLMALDTGAPDTSVNDGATDAPADASGDTSTDAPGDGG